MSSFNEYWNRPVTYATRAKGALIGSVGGFWIFLLGRLMFGPMPISLTVLGYWIIAGIITGIILGIIFPRIISLALYPFTLLGIGGSS